MELEKEIEELKETIKRKNKFSKRKRKSKDVINNKYGRLLVIKRAENGKYGEQRFLCKCDCGNEKVIFKSSLLNGSIISCGCYKKEIHSTLFKLTPGIAAFNHTYKRYLLGAKRRNLIFNLTKDQFREITKKNCYYCNQKPSNIGSYRKYGTYLYSGIDRINSNIGYIIENCVPCYKKCNLMKRDTPIKDFKDQIIKIYFNYINRLPYDN